MPTRRYECGLRRRRNVKHEYRRPDGGVSQARSHLAFMRGGAARKRGMKVYYESYQVGRRGANLLALAYAHLITPRYEEGCWTSASGACPATTEAERRPAVGSGKSGAAHAF